MISKLLFQMRLQRLRQATHFALLRFLIDITTGLLFLCVVGNFVSLMFSGRVLMSILSLVLLVPVVMLRGLAILITDLGDLHLGQMGEELDQNLQTEPLRSDTHSR